VKRLIVFIVLVVLVMALGGLSTSASSDTGAPLSDSNTLDNEMISSQVEATNSSASATITITMYAVDDG
jgi:Na+-transporting methylmalonyl-CoA/oxaloacetate decarboxylase gamma subunit